MSSRATKRRKIDRTLPISPSPPSSSSSTSSPPSSHPTHSTTFWSLILPFISHHSDFFSLMRSVPTLYTFVSSLAPSCSNVNVTFPLLTSDLNLCPSKPQTFVQRLLCRFGFDDIAENEWDLDGYQRVKPWETTAFLLGMSRRSDPEVDLDNPKYVKLSPVSISRRFPFLRNLKVTYHETRSLNAQFTLRSARIDGNLAPCTITSIFGPPRKQRPYFVSNRVSFHLECFENLVEFKVRHTGSLGQEAVRMCIVPRHAKVRSVGIVRDFPTWGMLNKYWAPHVEIDVKFVPECLEVEGMTCSTTMRLSKRAVENLELLKVTKGPLLRYERGCGKKPVFANLKELFVDFEGTEKEPWCSSAALIGGRQMPKLEKIALFGNCAVPDMRFLKSISSTLKMLSLQINPNDKTRRTICFRSSVFPLLDEVRIAFFHTPYKRNYQEVFARRYSECYDQTDLRNTGTSEKHRVRFEGQPDEWTQLTLLQVQNVHLRFAARTVFVNLRGLFVFRSDVDERQLSEKRFPNLIRRKVNEEEEGDGESDEDGEVVEIEDSSDDDDEIAENEEPSEAPSGKVVFRVGDLRSYFGGKKKGD